MNRRTHVMPETRQCQFHRAGAPAQSAFLLEQFNGQASTSHGHGGGQTVGAAADNTDIGHATQYDIVTMETVSTDSAAAATRGWRTDNFEP